MMREEARQEESQNPLYEDVRETQHVIDKTPNFGRYPSSDSTNTEGDNCPIQWMLKKRDVSASKKGKEKIFESESMRRLFPDLTRRRCWQMP